MRRVIVPLAGRVELCALFAAMRFTRGAEIGVWTGLFSKRLCHSVPGLHLTCVDPWRAYSSYRDRKNDQARLDAAYRETLDRLRPFSCRILRMDSLDAAAMVPNASLDFVYIDGNHGETFVRADLDAWVPKVRRGGIVAGHDYGMDRPHIEVQAAVDAYAAAHGIDRIYVLTADKSPSFFWVTA